MNKFKTFTSAKPENSFGETNLFSEGRQNMTVDSIYLVNDRVKTLKTREMKTTVPPWKDKTDQLAVVFKNKTGVGTHRFQGAGYVRYSELSKEQKKEYTSLGDEGYAVHNKTKMRLVDDNRTAQCDNIMNQFMQSCGLPEGSDINSIVGCEVSADVTIEEYDGRDVMNIGGWRSPKETVVDHTEETVVDEPETY